LIDKGTKNRYMGTTDINSISSRSHAIFDIELSKLRNNKL